MGLVRGQVRIQDTDSASVKSEEKKGVLESSRCKEGLYTKGEPGDYFTLVLSLIP